jgi:hypothetical protein
LTSAPIGSTKSISTVFFNLKEFAMADLLPQDASLTAGYFVNNWFFYWLTGMLGSWGYRPSQVTSAFQQFQVPHCSACPRTNGQPSVRPCSPPPYSPALAIADFCPFVWLKQQLSKRTLDSEENVLETISDIMSELPKNEATVRSCIGKKM